MLGKTKGPNISYLENNKQKLHEQRKTMSMKEIENAKVTKANTTRGNVYTIHTNKYMNTFQINQQQQA